MRKNLFGARSSDSSSCGRQLFVVGRGGGGLLQVLEMLPRGLQVHVDEQRRNRRVWTNHADVGVGREHVQEGGELRIPHLHVLKRTKSSRFCFNGSNKKWQSSKRILLENPKTPTPILT